MEYAIEKVTCPDQHGGDMDENLNVTDQPGDKSGVNNDQQQPLA